MQIVSTSRRRHTRYWRDWSSDVCSSDLRGYEERNYRWRKVVDSHPWSFSEIKLSATGNCVLRNLVHAIDLLLIDSICNCKIGRASCRERGKIRLLPDQLKKKKQARQPAA